MWNTDQSAGSDAGDLVGGRAFRVLDLKSSGLGFRIRVWGFAFSAKACLIFWWVGGR